MQPIVDGLKSEYGETVVFEQINAGSGEGKILFNEYQLLGHPGFVLLDDTGDVLWKSVGEITKGTIESVITATLEENVLE